MINFCKAVIILAMILCEFTTAQYLNCTESEFACLDGSECIPGEKFCDGSLDCGDFSDEIRYHKIYSGHIPCRKGNNFQICSLPTGQSEKYSVICTGNVTCRDDEFECMDGSGCIPALEFCDFHYQCRDYSDEISYNNAAVNAIPCRPGTSKDRYYKICQLPIDQEHKYTHICKNYSKCTDEEFACADGSGCTLAEQFCDGNHRCSDRSDEVRYIIDSEESKKGIRCRTDKFVCLLPNDQASKQKIICTKDPNCSDDEFACANGYKCIEGINYCDNWANCDDRSDEITYDKFKEGVVNGTLCRQHEKVCVLPTSQASKRSVLCKKDINCDSDEFACQDGSYCLPQNEFCDRFADCADESDHIRYNKHTHNETDGVPCRTDKNVCLLPQSQAWKNTTFCTKSHECEENEFACSDGSGCVAGHRFCDMSTDCSDESDQTSFVIGLNDGEGIPCRQMHRTCLLPHNHTHLRETFCPKSAQCEDNEFSCADGSGCLEAREFCDGHQNCYDNSDEKKYAGENFNGEILCNSIDSFAIHRCLLPRSRVCDNKTHCKHGLDECLCNEDGETSFLDNKCFRCLSHRHVILPISQLCDGVFDCPDLSDECLCLRRKNVPEICKRISWDLENLYVPRIVCETTTSNFSIVSTEKVCNNRIECQGGIDEENCNTDCEEIKEQHASNSFHGNNVKCGFTCSTTRVSATRCDKKISCEMDVGIEECYNCENPPEYCSRIKTGTTRYLCPESVWIKTQQICDGYADCENGTEEKNCFDKFYCRSGDRINIPSNKKCDQQKDCEDGSDEIGCSFACDDTGIVEYVDLNQVCDGKIDCFDGGDECLEKCITSVFSDVESMISSNVILPFIWIISLVAFIGNLLVAFFSFYGFVHPDERQSKVSRLNKGLLLNLSIADLLVGIYTISICIQNASQKGRYCLTDREWRSSQTCSALGAILLIGSEQSVFTLTLITGFRMYTLLKPFSVISAKKTIFLTILSWAVTLALGLIPLSSTAEDLFITSIRYKQNPLFTTIEHGNVENYTKWLLLTEEKAINSGLEYENIGTWSLLERLIKKLNPDYTVDRKFGYYSTHGVCLPTLFPDPRSDRAWFYSLLIIILNFSAFLFIFIGYLIIYRTTTRDDDARLSSSSGAKRSEILQKKISRIILTDFLCWMPICIMAFLQAGGVQIPQDAYVPVGLILIPINSALNPFLYSDVPDYIWEKLRPVRFWIHNHCIEKVTHGLWIREDVFLRGTEQDTAATNGTNESVLVPEIPMSPLEKNDQKQVENQQTTL